MISVIAGAPFVAYTEDAPTGLAGTIGAQLVAADETVAIARDTAHVTEVVVGSGIYQWQAPATPLAPGPYAVVWDTGGSSPQFATELVQVAPGSPYTPTGDVTAVADLTDLAVFIPWARRACEGPYGPPQGRPSLADDVVYPMIADACAEIILQSGKLFDHELNVTARDPLAGFPIQWKTSEVLDQWEGALIICQIALDYTRFLARDLKTSVTVQNEGTNYEYTTSAMVIRDYLKLLQTERDKALTQLMAIHPIIDRYASNIRVRDQVTVSMLEWWDTNPADMQIGGSGGGQWAVRMPWAGGWRSEW